MWKKTTNGKGTEKTDGYGISAPPRKANALKVVCVIKSINCAIKQ